MEKVPCLVQLNEKIHQHDADGLCPFESGYKDKSSIKMPGKAACPKQRRQSLKTG
jgi:hypothetical protein